MSHSMDAYLELLDRQILDNDGRMLGKVDTSSSTSARTAVSTSPRCSAAPVPSGRASVARSAPS